jgi:hypothetical protein
MTVHAPGAVLPTLLFTITAVIAVILFVPPSVIPSGGNLIHAAYQRREVTGGQLSSTDSPISLSVAVEAGLSSAGKECRTQSAVWRRSLMRFLAPHFDLLGPGHYRSADFKAAVADEARHDFDGSTSVLVTIYNGTVRLHPPQVANAKLHEWLKGMLRELHNVAERHHLPDAFFKVTTSDWPEFLRSSVPSLLLFSVNTGNNAFDVPVPGGQFGSWYDSNSGQLRGIARALPWRNRSHTAIWRGTLMCANWKQCFTRCPRMLIRQVAEQHPELLSVRFSSYYKDVDNCSLAALSEILAADEAAQDRSLTHAQQAGYRFAIASDGHSYSSGHKNFLHLGATVFRQRTNFLEFFDPALEPWVHNVPFDCRSVADCELVELLDKSKHEPLLSAMERIALHGSLFSEAHLSAAARACYTFALLHATQPLFSRDGNLSIIHAAGVSISDYFGKR